MRVGDGTPGPGRPAGLKNKINKQLKEMILGALEDAGGQQYLREQAKANPTAFMALLGKVLPTTLSGSVGVHQMTHEEWLESLE